MSYAKRNHCSLRFFVVVGASALFGACSPDRPDFPSRDGTEDSDGTDPDRPEAGTAGAPDTDGSTTEPGASSEPTAPTGVSLVLGAACTLGAECDSGFCVDGVCCLSGCEQECARCDAPGLLGSCSAEVDVSCQDGNGTCNAAGQCVVATKLSLGEQCGANDECGSGECVVAEDGQMRCCDSACDGLCEACSAAGQCDRAPTDDATCEVVTCPADTLCTTYPAALTAERCAGPGVCATEESHCLPSHEPQGAECGSGLACDGNGECASTCTGSDVWCTDACVDTDSDAENCGECGNACETGLVCSDGECVANCGAEQVTCGNSCVNPLTNSNNCGASGDCTGDNAGTKCTSPASCVDGTCQVVCSNGQINCDGSCIDPNTSATFCGASMDCAGTNRGAPCATVNGYACEEGVCRLQCAANLIACDGTCINPTNNEEFCGAAIHCEETDRGVECDSTEACVNGVCKLLDGQECNANSDCRSNQCTQFYFDDDGDGFHSADVDSMKICGTVPPSSDWGTEDNDCCDTNADVNPEYEGDYMETPAPGCGNSFFDYNCDGELTPDISTEECDSFTDLATNSEDCPNLASFSTGSMTGSSSDCGEYGTASACAVIDGACEPVRGAAWVMACY